MKKLSSMLNKLSNKSFLLFWLAFHFAVVVFFLFSLILSKKTLKVDADLFTMLPESFSYRFLEDAEKKLSEATGQNVFILSCNKDFNSAKENAAKVYEKLKDSTNIQSIFLYQDSEVVNETERFIFENRFNLIDGGNADKNNPAAYFSEKALEKLYSPFTYTSLEYIDKDPFLLTEMEMEKYLSSIVSTGTSLSLKDNVLARQYNGSWYVMIRGILSKKGAALASKDNGITEIISACSEYEKDGQRFIFSGTPFHSNKSSTNASREITLISVVSLAAVLLILLFVFRTAVPVILSICSVSVSVLTAFLFTISFFGKIHVLTLVFGTTLIGSCIDYSLHFFINWKSNKSLKSGSEIRNYLFSGLALSLASTEICFAVLFFAPFELLKQMSLFSLSGILSSFLSVVCLYPLVKLPPENKRHIYGTEIIKTPAWYNKKIAGRIAISAMFVFSVASIALGYKRCNIKNDLSRLYKMEGRLLNDQIESAKVLNYAPRGWFIISGASADELLVNEKNFASALRKEADDIPLFCTSDFLPSIEEQKKSKAIYENLLPHMKVQLATIGEEESGAEEIVSEWENNKNRYTSIEYFPDFIKEACSSSWLGQIDEKWYSVIMPSMLPENFDAENFASGFNGHVFYINKVQNISRDMDVLTKMILKFFACAYVLIFMVLKFFYKLKQALKIISIPLLVILMVSSVYAIAGIHLEFFSITGIILVFGLGLDYIIYMAEMQKRKENPENKKLESFAIFLSFITTAVSFGAIALSSFVPVHLMGLAILTGLITAWLSSVLYERDS